MTESFKTKVALDLMLDRTDNYDVETKTVEIVWDLEIDFRSWGLKDIVIGVPSQTINVFLNVWDEVADKEEEISLEIKDVRIERVSDDFSALAPQMLEFYRGKWTLVF